MHVVVRLNIDSNMEKKELRVKSSLCFLKILNLSPLEKSYRMLKYIGLIFSI